MDNNKRDRRRLAFRAVFTICSLACVVFIFSNSAEIGDLSVAKSGTAVRLLNGIMAWLGLGFRFSDHLVRKLAHFAEYALLGFFLLLSLQVYTRRILAHISWPLFLGLVTAVFDEFFQTTVPGRSGMVQDVVVDFGGISAGILAGLFAVLLISTVRNARRKPL